MNEIPNAELQRQFLELCKRRLSNGSSFVFELSELLDVSQDSVYRRLRGETSLDFREIVKICNHFQVSLDQLENSQPGGATFHYSLLDNQQDFVRHWSNMLQDLQKINKNESSSVVYAAIDIPIFHHFNHPSLMAFKMFYWLREVLNDESVMNKRFDQKYISQEILDLGSAIYTEYCKVDSTEIWTENSLHSTLKQIQYYWESGMFKDKKDALFVCNQLIELLESIEQQAELSSKIDSSGVLNSNTSNYILYQSDIEITSNTVLVDMDEKKAVYMGFQTFNTMITSNPKFCKDTENWLDNHIKNSVQLSSTSQKFRYQFFNSLVDKVNEVIIQIEKN